MKSAVTAVLLVFVGVIPQMTAAKYQAISEAFGMNVHLRQRVSDDDWETVLTLAEEAGVQWAREQFNWDVIEPTDDAFSFDTYDAVVSVYEAHDISVLGLLTYSSAWASSNSGATDYEFYPPDLDAWKNYVGTVGARYAGEIDYWEIWNEPNHEEFWKGSVEDYRELLETASEAIRAENPNAKIVLGGLSGADADYLDSLYTQLSDPSIIDVVAVHPYRVIDGDFNYAPETALNGLNNLTTDVYNVKAVMNLRGQSATPIWLTEVGWTTGESGISEHRQAEYLTRLYTQALAIPDVNKIFWYSFHDTSENESYTDAQFGLLEDDYAKKLSFSAYQFMRTYLDGRFFKDQSLPGARLIDDFSTGLGWHFAGTRCTNGTLNDHDNGKLHIRYVFTRSDNCYAPIAINTELPQPTRALQFKVKGDSDDTLLRVRIIDARGEIFQYNLGFMPNEWLFYTLQLDEPASFWGGDQDGVLDQPLTFNAFVLDDTDGSREEGEVFFDDLTATSRGNTYLYRFHRSKKDSYAYWTAGKERLLNLYLVGAGKMREYRWRKNSKDHESANSIFRVQSDRAVTFLQTL